MDRGVDPGGGAPRPGGRGSSASRRIPPRRQDRGARRAADQSLGRLALRALGERPGDRQGTDPIAAVPVDLRRPRSRAGPRRRHECHRGAGDLLRRRQRVLAAARASSDGLGSEACLIVDAPASGPSSRPAEVVGAAVRRVDLGARAVVCSRPVPIEVVDQRQLDVDWVQVDGERGWPAAEARAREPPRRRAPLAPARLSLR